MSSRRALEVARAYTKRLILTADRDAVVLTRIMRRVEKRMAAAILARKGGVKSIDIDRLNASMAQIVSLSQDEFLLWTQYASLDGGRIGAARQAASIAASLGFPSVEALPVSRIAATFESFQASIESRTLVAVGERYDTLWRSMWDDRWTATMRTMEDRFIQAAIAGDPWTAVAKDLVGPLEELEIAGHIPSDAFARGFTRAKLTEVANYMGMQIATEAGFNKFRNAGISDERQSDECAEASSYEPMTLEEWNETEVGPPPRHVLNCRCALMAVPDEEMIEMFEQAERGELEEVELEEVR